MILFDEQIPFVKEVLGSFDEVQSVVGRSLTNEQIVDSGATALFVRSTTQVNAALLHNSKVQFVASATAGVDHVSIADLERSGIYFYYAAGSNAWAVAEYVIETAQDLCETKPPIIGVIGCGNVGSRLSQAAAKLGWEVFVSDPPLGMNDVSLKEIVSNVDVLTLHVPLTTKGAHATHRVIGATELALMKSGALLINTSRGGVVDESALLEALVSRNSTLIAALDVFENEPTPNVELIRAAQRTTPHVAGYTRNAKEDGAWMVMTEWAKWKGVTLPNRTTAAAAEGEYRNVERDSEIFRAAYIADPTAVTFDQARKEYPLLSERPLTAIVKTYRAG